MTQSPLGAHAQRMTIGEVLTHLRTEFPAVSIPKIRFLEDQGLVKPERTASGYRKFSTADIERLRYILRMQRDHYLPLKVIGEHLEAMDRGLEPPPVQSVVPTVPAVALDHTGVPGVDTFRERSDVRLSRAELIKISGAAPELVAQLEDFGLLKAQRGTGHYGADDLVIARTAQELAAYGLEARHLRGFKSAADREAGLVQQVISPLAASSQVSARAQAEETAAELAALTVRLHATLVKAILAQG